MYEPFGTGEQAAQIETNGFDPAAFTEEWQQICFRELELNTPGFLAFRRSRQNGKRDQDDLVTQDKPARNKLGPEEWIMESLWVDNIGLKILIGEEYRNNKIREKTNQKKGIGKTRLGETLNPI